ncbi:MAG: DUF4175 family protein [Candidatus Zixiibacteriota bacterium]
MAELVAKLELILRKARAKYSQIAIFTAVLNNITALFIGVLLLTILNSFFEFSTSIRSVMLFIVIFIEVLLLWQFTGQKIIRKINLREIAILFEKHFPQLEDRLVSAWELLTDTKWEELKYSRDLVYGIGEQAITSAGGLSPKKLLPYDKLEQSFRLLIVTGLLVLTIFVSMPKLTHKGLYYSIHPQVAIPKDTDTKLSLYPGDTEIVKYAPFFVHIEAKGKIPPFVTMERRFRRGRPIIDEIDMHPDSFGVYNKSIDEVRQDFEYRIEGGDYTTDWYKVKVADKPRILQISLNIDYPDYTGMKSHPGEPNNGNVDAIRGTIVKVQARASKELEDAFFVFESGDTISAEVNQKEITGQFQVKRDDKYKIICRDEEGYFNPEPITYEIFARDDQHPTVKISVPGQDVDITEEMKVPLQVLAQDDFGFSKFHVAYYVNEGDTSRTKLPFKSYREPYVVVEFLWSLVSMRLLPEDVVYYWVEGYDNDYIRGPKMAKSKIYAARFPSITEIVDQVDKEQQAQKSDLSKALEQQHEMAEKFREVAKEMRSTEKMDYENREDINSMMQKQQKMVENIEQMAEQMDQTIQKIEENALAAAEMVDKMRQVQDIMQEIATPEMKKAMEEMREAMKNVDMEKMKEAMKDFEMSQEEMMQNLERTLSLLKRIQMEQKLSQMMEMTKQAEESQSDISENSSDNNSDEMQRKQDAQSEKLKSMEKTMKELAEMMKEFEDTPKEQADSLSEAMMNQNMPQNSEQISQQLGQKNSKMAKKKSSQLQKQLQDLQKDLQQLQQNMNQQLREKLKKEMTNSSRKLNYLSQKQEQLMDKSCQSGVSREEIESIARQQQEVSRSLEKVSQEISEIAGQTMFLPQMTQKIVNDALKQSQESMKQLSNFSCNRAGQNQKKAMGSMNMASSMMLSSMNKMCNSSSCPSGSQSMMQQMESMCQGQQSINQQSMPLMSSSGQPGGMSPQQMAAAQKLSSEQEALRKSLEELNKEFSEQNDMLGRLDKTADQMKQVSEDLRRGDVSKKTMEHQERILQRLLDAQKSLNKRDYSKKRKANAGEDLIRQSPPPLPEDLGERKDQLQRDLLRVLSLPYPKQYEGSIRDYFNKLQEIQIEENSESNK